MKKLLIGLLVLGSVSSYAIKTGNICTVALFEKNTDAYGNSIPGKALGVGTAVDTMGTSAAFSKLHDVSRKRAVIFRGVIDMAGAFKTQFEEVDQDKSGRITFQNPTLLSKENYYYSPYPEQPAKNKPALVEMQDYMATISCILYKKY